MHACIIGSSAHTRSCGWIGISSISCYIYVTAYMCMWSISDKHLEEETIKSPITWFQDGVDLGAASRLVTRLESRFESACCEYRVHLVVEFFFYRHVLYKLGWLQSVGVEPYILQKWFCFLNGAVTKNRTITKPSCHVRRLSKLKPAPLIYLYLFVCSATKRVPSFVEAWLCYGCTYLDLLFMPSPNQLACIK